MFCRSFCSDSVVLFIFIFICKFCALDIDFAHVSTICNLVIIFWNCFGSGKVLFFNFICKFCVYDINFVHFLLANVLSVLLRYTVSYCPIGIFKLFLITQVLQKGKQFLLH
jgi:hypothetical protein